MSNKNNIFTQNETAKFFSRINSLTQAWSLSSFIKDEEYKNAKLKYSNSFINICIFTFIAIELVAFNTQKNLSEKQTTDRILLGLSHPILIMYYIIGEYHMKRITDLILILCISTKEVYNDQSVEKQMIKKAKFYSTAYCLCCSSSLISYGFDALMQVIHSDGTFTTVITAWPDVTDKSLEANVVRVISYIIWWLFMTRVSAVYVLVISTIVALSHQFKNLQSYFYSLNDIFKNTHNETDRIKAEEKYVQALKVGIQVHSKTLWCIKEVESIFNVVISGQIIVNIGVFSLLLLQMVNSERTLMNTLSIISTSSAMLGSTGCFMWNIGDIPVEAELIATAIYSSGWQNCQGKKSKEICKLLITAMMQSQMPIVIRAAGIFEISYQSYLAIVKASYSAFSLLY